MSDSQEAQSTFEQLPTFYPPNNEKEDFEITHKEFEQFKNAIKDANFRKLLAEYVDEVQDPENQKTYQSEVRQLEKENGNVVHFLNPVPGYVLKTSVDGVKKCFINVCSNPLIKPASAEKSVQQNQNGSLWSIPYAQSPMREDMDKAGSNCQVYDVIFNPDVLVMASRNTEIRSKIDETALEAVESSFNVKLDRNNVKKPKLQYKGFPRATVIKYKIGQEPPAIVNRNAIKNEIPPQAFKKEKLAQSKSGSNQGMNKCEQQPSVDSKQKPISKLEKKLSDSDPPACDTSEGKPRTVPKHSLKYRSHVDMQDYCLDNQKFGSSSKTTPDEIILTIDLPLLSDSSTLEADVLEDGWTFELQSKSKALYELALKLPYEVHPESSKAKFEKDKRKLHVTMKTVKKAFMLSRSSSDESDVFEETEPAGEEVSEPNDKQEETKKVTEKETDVGYESNDSTENIPTVINGNVVVNSILKGSKNRFRSMSESWVEHLDHLNLKEDFVSLESLGESSEQLCMSESSGTEKSVRFCDQVQRQLFRSNSSILGQKKKNQKKNKNKRKNRERHNSEGSVSSFDGGDGDTEDSQNCEDGENCHEDDYIPPMNANKHKKQPSELAK